MIANTAAAMDQLTERIAAWAAGRSDIRAALVIGSRARTSDRPADEFSDLDLLLFCERPEQYLGSPEWVNEFGRPVVTFREGTIAGGKERRVLFEDALDVDFNFIPTGLIRMLNRYVGLKERAPWVLKVLPGKVRREIDRQVATAGGVLRRGYRVLFDKEHLLRGMLRSIPAKVVRTLPDQAEALNSIGDFWYHALWTARKLRRGELVVAQNCHGRLRRFLYDAVETLAIAEHGPEYDTWHDLRFLEQWADPATVEELHRLYAHYDPEDMARSLLATMTVFGRVAQAAMSRMGHVYPKEMEEQVTAWVIECLG
jgi:aminoglycoside 6-adenylyltransferase